MSPYDVKRELEPHCAPKNTDWALVNAPRQQFIAVDGSGDPNTSAEYARAVQALYAVAYTVKFASKRTLGRDMIEDAKNTALAKKGVPAIAEIHH